ncbi:molybdenum cofactor biosynthesis protein MoaE [Alteromonas sp. chi3]|uniref:Molybdopterin synthase catalytic subunit n=2 Tax=Alteromonas gilva TaxID=2987522 RepID=A0ABT5L109_9ALTE|nr:molybdenum cofactor biosynthesis protein MoaE [Alteromonas gilva]
MFVEVGPDDFSQQALYDRLCETDRASQSGAVVTFTGRVRDYNAQGHIEGIELEYYPGMTEAALQQLLKQAQQRFALTNAGIVHRVGRLANHAQIVWVGTCAAHRNDAFNAASYLMDMLKQSVPIWKKEWANGEAEWVAAKTTDSQAAMRWLQETDEPGA